jgi:hypothetical protein
LRPGPGSRRLQNLLTKLLSEKNFKRQCRWEFSRNEKTKLNKCVV